MFRSLRKGHSSVYLQHEHTGHSVGAEKFEAEFIDGRLVLRLALRPVDGNQRQDESYLDELPLVSLTLDDAYVIDHFRNYLNAQRCPITAYELQIVSRGRLFSFAVTISESQQHAYEALHFTVRRDA